MGCDIDTIENSKSLEKGIGLTLIANKKNGKEINPRLKEIVILKEKHEKQIEKCVAKAVIFTEQRIKEYLLKELDWDKKLFEAQKSKACTSVMNEKSGLEEYFICKHNLKLINKYIKIIEDM